MKRILRIVAVALTGFLVQPALADISMPDALIYGTVSRDGVPVTAADDVTIIARMEGREAPIAMYRMGDRATVGDRYVLQIPHSLQDDGRTPSTKTAQAGQTASIYLQAGSGPEQKVADVVIPESGDVQQLDLDAMDEAASLQTIPGAEATRACGSSGGGCGAVGMICMCLMACGLAQMKAKLIIRRRR